MHLDALEDPASSKAEPPFERAHAPTASDHDHLIILIVGHPDGLISAQDLVEEGPFDEILPRLQQGLEVLGELVPEDL